MNFSRRAVLSGIGLSALGACAHQPHGNLTMMGPRSPKMTAVHQWLNELPISKETIFAAVYDMPDQTGQLRTSGETVQNYSRAVSQGASSLLMQGLGKVAKGSFFKVLDRSAMEKLTLERRIMRDASQSAADTSFMPPPLLLAGVIIDGAVIGYDSNIETSGKGIRFRGIGGFKENRRDIVTVTLRATSTRTGEVLHSVLSEKSVHSVLMQGSVFSFLDGTDDILEIEGGISSNEPGLFALSQAIDFAIYELVVEGAVKGIWDFANPTEFQKAVVTYQDRTKKCLQSCKS